MAMSIRAIVNQSDYDNMVRNYFLKEDIEAALEVNGVMHAQGEIAYRGTTSLSYPKKGFKIKFKKKNLYKGNTGRIDLSAAYADKSLIRERLCFDLFARTQVVTSQAWHVDFSIHNKEGNLLERGLYTGIEHIDEYFFSNRQRQIGALYKADGGMVNGQFMGAILDRQPEAILKILYDQENPKPILAKGFWASVVRSVFQWPQIQIASVDEEDYRDLDRFIQTVDSLNSETIAQHLPELMADDSYLDWLAVNTLVQSNDTYHKNYYLHNRMEDDRWEILPWDYDLTFGRNWNDYCDGLCDDLSEGTSIKGSVQMTNHLSRRVLSNPLYFGRLRDKLLALLRDEFTEEKLAPKIDAYYAEIRDLAHLDTRKWATNEQFDHERERLKDWIKRRRTFLYQELQATPTPTKAADTVVASLAFNKPKLIEGDLIRFEALIQNIGLAPAGPTVGVAFVVDGRYVTFGTSGPLPEGASRQIKSVSDWKASVGEHTLTAVVDDVNRYPELSETNNTLEINFRVEPQPGRNLSDVTVRDVAFERNEVGQVILAALVENQGKAETPAVVGVAFFVDDRYTTFGVSNPLPPGQTKPIRAVSPLTIFDSHKVTAIVDDINRFPEEREDNNSLTKEMHFGPRSSALADTILLNVSLGSGRFTAGDEVTFEALVRNIGSASTGDVVGVAFLVDGQPVTFGTAPAMGPGETRTIRSVSTWRATAGPHRLKAIVDDVNRYPELSETNNSFELPFHIIEAGQLNLPDSIVKSIEFDQDGDGHITLKATVQNIGSAPTPEVVGVAFLIDGVYATYSLGDPMAPQTTRTLRAVKSLALRGSHTITAIVDDVNRYGEINNQNNTLTRQINFG